MNKTLLVALTGITIGGVGFGLVTPVTVILLEQNNTPALLNGFLQTLQYVAVAIFAFFTGRIIDKYTVTRVITYGYIFWIIGALGHIYWYNFYVLVPVKIISGLGATFIFVGTEVLINRISDESNRGKNIGIYAVLLSTGIAIGSFLIWTVTIKDYLPFLIAAGIVGLGFIVQSFFIGYVKIVHFEERPARMKLSEMPSLSLITAFLYGMFESSIIVVIPLFGLRNSFSETDISYFMGAFVVGGIILLYYLSKMSDKFPKTKMLMVVSVILTLLTPLPAFLQSFIILIILFFFIGGLVPAYYTIGLNFTLEKTTPEQISQANGFFATFYGVGTVMGPFLGSFLIDLHTDYGYWLFSSVVCFILILTLISKKSHS
ncbi:MAG: putative multi-drug resistance efflux pump [Melioribacteraceae bacterium]|nr:MAG: putative multi-drug resistance efflux pump [Melioribacteraceae bacterium]